MDNVQKDSAKGEVDKLSLYFPVKSSVVDGSVSQIKLNSQGVYNAEFTDLGNDHLLVALIQTGVQSMKTDMWAAASYREGYAFARKILKDQAASNKIAVTNLNRKVFDEYLETMTRQFDGFSPSQIVKIRMEELHLTDPDFARGIDALKEVGPAKVVPALFQLGAVEMYDVMHLQIEKGSKPQTGK